MERKMGINWNQTGWHPDVIKLHKVKKDHTSEIHGDMIVFNKTESKTLKSHYDVYCCKCGEFSPMLIANISRRTYNSCVTCTGLRTCEPKIRREKWHTTGK
jgi:hypothetical protein